MQMHSKCSDIKKKKIIMTDYIKICVNASFSIKLITGLQVLALVDSGGSPYKIKTNSKSIPIQT